MEGETYGEHGGDNAVHEEGSLGVDSYTDDRKVVELLRVGTFLQVVPSLPEHCAAGYKHSIVMLTVNSMVLPHLTTLVPVASFSSDQFQVVNNNVINIGNSDRY